MKQKSKYKRKGYPYRNRSGYLKTGVGMITNAVVVGSIPNISGTAAETNIKDKYAEGMGNMAGKFPAVGSMIGTGMVLKQVRKLKYPKGKRRRR